MNCPHRSSSNVQDLWSPQVARHCSTQGKQWANMRKLQVRIAENQLTFIHFSRNIHFHCDQPAIADFKYSNNLFKHPRKSPWPACSVSLVSHSPLKAARIHVHLKQKFMGTWFTFHRRLTSDSFFRVQLFLFGLPGLESETTWMTVCLSSPCHARHAHVSTAEYACLRAQTCIELCLRKDFASGLLLVLIETSKEATCQKLKQLQHTQHISLASKTSTTYSCGTLRDSLLDVLASTNLQQLWISSIVIYCIHNEKYNRRIQINVLLHLAEDFRIFFNMFQHFS